MNKRFPFSFGLDTKTDILFLSLENSNVASFLNPLFVKLYNIPFETLKLYYSTSSKTGFPLNVESYFPNFSTNTLRAASVGNPDL